LNRCKQCSLRRIKIIFMKTGAIKVCRRQECLDVSKPYFNVKFLKVTVSRDRSYTLCHVIRCPKWPLLEDDLTIHAWNRWSLTALERWPLKRVKLYSNISWAGLKVTVRQSWPVRQVRLYNLSKPSNKMSETESLWSILD
jgi:hypothetical protein